jgi:trehalose 6-phosphate phosphatase
MAGSVDLIQRGFAGVETRADTLHLNPYWPDGAGALELGLTYRGHSLTLSVQDGRIQVCGAPGAHRPIVRVHCRGETRTIGPGGGVTFPLRESPS